MKTSYDRTTDSLYIELRPLAATRTVEVEADVMLDLGEDGGPSATTSSTRPGSAS